MPGLQLSFEREEGYWTGAMIVNIAACEIWLVIGFVGILIVTMPDVNWPAPSSQ